MINYHEFEQLSQACKVIKLGKVSGTRMKKMLSKRQSIGLMDELVAETISEQAEEIRPNAAMIRGVEMEPLARKAYEDLKSTKVHEYGFITNSEFPAMGLSPDGLVDDVGAVEFKCPSSKAHIAVIRTNKVPADYVPQLLTYFIVCSHLEWIDFVSYDPQIHIRPIHVVRVQREDVKDKIEEAINTFRVFSTKMEAQIESISF